MMPGEWDWMKRLGGFGGLGGGMRTPGILAQPTPGAGGLFGGSGPQGDPSQDARLAFAAQLLSSSGPTPGRKNFAQMIGDATQASLQARNASQNNALQQQYVQSQIARNERPEPRKPIAVAGADGKPIYVDESEAVGKTPYMQPDRPEAVPNDVQEFEYAQKQGFKGSYLDFQRAKASAGRDPGSAPRPQYYNTARGLVKVYPDGREEIVQGTEPTGSSGRPIPVGLADDLKGNAQVISMIDEVLPQLDTPAGKDAVGARNAVITAVTPDAISDNVKNFFDPNGTETRALMTNLNSFIVKQRNGAAVTVQEFARQRGYLPSDSDNPQTAKTKLMKLRKALESENVYISDFAESQGYRKPPILNQAPNGMTLYGAEPQQPASSGGWSAVRTSR